MRIAIRTRGAQETRSPLPSQITFLQITLNTDKVKYICHDNLLNY